MWWTDPPLSLCAQSPPELGVCPESRRSRRPKTELSLADAEVPGLCLGALLEPSQAIPPPFISSVPTAPLRLLFLHAAYLAEWYDRGESKT